MLEPAEIGLPVLIGLLALLDPDVERERAHGVDDHRCRGRIETSLVE